MGLGVVGWLPNGRAPASAYRGGNFVRNEKATPQFTKCK